VEAAVAILAAKAVKTIQQIFIAVVKADGIS
jgi:hypothetical protein